MKTNFVSLCLKVLLAVTVLCQVSAPAVSAKPGKDSRVMDVIRKYGRCDGVGSITIGPFLMGIARKAASDEEGADFMKYLNRMAIFSAEEADSCLKADISADLAKALDGYETAMEMKDGEDDMAIYFSMPSDDIVSEMVLVSDSELAVILMIGEMPVSELKNIAAEAMAD